LDEESPDPNELMRLKAEVTQLRASLVAVSQYASVGILLPAFLHSASHALHSLNALVSALIEERRQSHRRKRIIKEIVAGLRELQQFLDRTRLLAGQNHSDRGKSNNDLRSIIEEAIAIALDAQDIETTVEWNSYHKLQVDAGGFLGAVVNILMNAREAIRDSRRHGIISIKVRDTDRSSRPHLEIAICDNGTGIPDSDANRVFLPGFSTRSNRMGLGLTIAKAVIEDHGGAVAIASKRDDGAAVVIQLPVRTLASVVVTG